jgi:dTDP-4-amino-4,6-dideoxygalactose transaminase
MYKWVANKTIDNNLLNELLSDSIVTNTFTNYGPCVKKLEETIRNKLVISDNKAVIAVVNGALALTVIKNAIDLTDNIDSIWLTQSFTFPASAQGSLMNTIIVDIDNENDVGIDLESCAKLKHDGIIITNIFGYVCDLKKYLEYCESNNKYLIFDNAATPYTFYNGSNSCNYGTASIISLHHTKPIGFAEGGIIIIDKKYEYNARRLLNFGIDNYCDNPLWHRLGNNYKMSDISASYCLMYLDRFDIILEHHKKMYEYFKTKISKINGVKLINNYGEDSLVACFPLIFENSKNADPNLYLNNNIFCRKYYNPLDCKLVKSKRLFEHILCFPCNIDLDTNYIDNLLEFIIKFTNI